MNNLLEELESGPWSKLISDLRKERYINKIKEICIDIGCSGLSPDLCQNRPYECEIIKKIFKYDQYCKDK